MPIHLTEIDGHDGDGTTTVRFATGKGFTSQATDTPANVVFEPRIIDPGNYEVHLYASDAPLAGGRSSASKGELLANNADGALDPLLRWRFDGHEQRLWRLPDGAAFPAGAELIGRGTVASIGASRRQLSFRLRDFAALLAETLLVTQTFLGNNSLPDGLEGVAADLKGKYLYQPYGANRQVLLVCVNSSKLIFLVAWRGRRTIAVAGVANRGGAIPADGAGDYASLASLLDDGDAPGAGEYRFYPGSATEGAYIRLGSDPGGDASITCDITEGASSADRTPAQLMRLMLADAGLPAMAVSGVAALDALAAVEVGFMTTLDGTAAGDGLDALARSCGAWWIGGPAEGIELGAWRDPDTMTPVASFARWQIQQLDPLKGENDGLPVYEVTVEYARNWHVQAAGDLASAVSQADREQRGQEYRTVTVTDAAVLARGSGARSVTVTTQLASAADASALASALLALYGPIRQPFAMRVASSELGDARPGRAITVTLDRFGLDDSAQFAVLGAIHELKRNFTTLIIWR